MHDSGRLLHLYYGAYLPDCDMRYLLDRGYFVSFTPDAAGYVGTEFSPDTQPSEYSCNGTGDFRISALQIRNADGNIATDIRYVSHRILSEKPALPGMRLCATKTVTAKRSRSPRSTKRRTPK